MGISTEKRLFDLEEEIKALKATYTISGGMMKLYESISPIFNITSDDITYRMTIRFTPDYSNVNNMIISSVFYEFKDNNNKAYSFTNYVRIIPPTDNYLLLTMPALIGTVQIKIVSNIPGTFTRIQ